MSGVREVVGGKMETSVLEQQLKNEKKEMLSGRFRSTFSGKNQVEKWL